MDKLYYGVSEVAAILEETPVTVRFWSNHFSKFLSPRRNAKGNRQYTVAEIGTLKEIRYLTRDCGFSLDGVARKLERKGNGADNMLKIRESLIKIRIQLEQIKESL